MPPENDDSDGAQVEEADSEAAKGGEVRLESSEDECSSLSPVEDMDYKPSGRGMFHAGCSIESVTLLHRVFFFCRIAFGSP